MSPQENKSPSLFSSLAKETWKWVLEKSTRRILFLLCGEGGVLLLFQGYIAILLRANLTMPITKWHTKEVAIFAILFLLIFASVFLFGYLFRSVRKDKNLYLPIETLKIVPFKNHGVWFEAVLANNIKVCHCESRFWVSNIHSSPVQIAQCYPNTEFIDSRFTMHFGISSPDLRIDLKLKPEQTFFIALTIIGKLPSNKGGDLFYDIIFVDHYGNKHFLKNYQFKYGGNKNQTH